MKGRAHVTLYMCVIVSCSQTAIVTALWSCNNNGGLAMRDYVLWVILCNQIVKNMNCVAMMIKILCMHLITDVARTLKTIQTF